MISGRGPRLRLRSPKDEAAPGFRSAGRPKGTAPRAAHAAEPGVRTRRCSPLLPLSPTPLPPAVPVWTHLQLPREDKTPRPPQVLGEGPAPQRTPVHSVCAYPRLAGSMLPSAMRGVGLVILTLLLCPTPVLPGSCSR
nr:lymphocyte antigen 6H isoform X3 [Cavia porcellus]